jgi:hypothetical protein
MRNIVSRFLKQYIFEIIPAELGLIYFSGGFTFYQAYILSAQIEP